MDNHEFTRNDLYDFVWDERLSRLIELCGGTYAEVRELLEANNISSPPNGYWLRLRAKHQIEQIAFQKEKGDEVKSIYKPKTKQEKRVKVQVEKPVEKSTEKFDKLVSESQLIYQKESKGSDNDKLISIGYHSLKINVSPLIIEKALQFFNRVILEIKKVGGKVNAEPHSTYTIFDGEKFIISLREKQTKINVTNPEYCWQNYHHIGSGLLYFKIVENSWNSKERKDTAYASIEDNVPEIIEFLRSAAIKEKENRREQELHRIQAEKERMVKVDLEKRKSTELANFIKLKSDSEVWEKSRIIKNYLLELEKSAEEKECLLMICNAI